VVGAEIFDGIIDITNPGIQFINRPVGFYPQVAFQYFCATDQGGSPQISGLRVYLLSHKNKKIVRSSQKGRCLKPMNSITLARKIELAINLLAIDATRFIDLSLRLPSFAGHFQ